jgi:hypothetical protein
MDDRRALIQRLRDSKATSMMLMTMLSPFYSTVSILQGGSGISGVFGALFWRESPRIFPADDGERPLSSKHSPM